ncbi:MAG: asparagine synthase (glutamine-hydrolyzing) [Caulobacteraceae bacterium]
MCGIAGALDLTGALPNEVMAARVEVMTRQVAHRGPDADGVRVVGPCGLGHRRLAIIDLNPRASQPMSTADERLWVVFNGEIYNFRELRAELESGGCVFRTTSDTEVLLHGWRMWGEAMIARLRGMFAFALWDETRQSLVLARDRLGKKPLYYHEGDDEFLFASEIKSMLTWPGFERRIDLAVIHDYMTYHYCIGEESAFVGVRKVPPAHYMVVQRGQPPRLERYWRLAAIDPRNGARSHADLARELVERLDDAVACRMIADVPLGAFLSGGVDSSAVVARMATMSSQPVKTFSVGFDIAGFDETPFALKVAERYQTDHRAFTMGYDLVSELPRLIWHYGEPYADSSALVTFALAREIRKHVTVALTGDGGDEFFLGYSRYLRFKTFVERWREGVRPRLPYEPVLPGEATLLRDHYGRWIGSFREEHKQGGYGPALAEHLLTTSVDRLGLRLEGATPADAMDLAARVEVDGYLADDLNVKADIATMAVSLEGRSPFLDYQLADWAASLPQDRRVFERDGVLETKALLKLAMEPYLPAEILYRRKQGFSVPVKHWMRFEIRDFMVETLTSQRFRERGLISPRYVALLLDKHLNEHEDHGTRLWGLLCLELWHQTFIDRREDGPLDINVMGQAPVLRLAG